MLALQPAFWRGRHSPYFNEGHKEYRSAVCVCNGDWGRWDTYGVDMCNGDWAGMCDGDGGRCDDGWVQVRQWIHENLRAEAEAGEASNKPPSDEV